MRADSCNPCAHLCGRAAREPQAGERARCEKACWPLRVLEQNLQNQPFISHEGWVAFRDLFLQPMLQQPNAVVGFSTHGCLTATAPSYSTPSTRVCNHGPDCKHTHPGANNTEYMCQKTFHGTRAFAPRTLTHKGNVRCEISGQMSSAAIPEQGKSPFDSNNSSPRVAAAPCPIVQCQLQHAFFPPTHTHKCTHGRTHAQAIWHQRAPWQSVERHQDATTTGTMPDLRGRFQTFVAGSRVLAASASSRSPKLRCRGKPGGRTCFDTTCKHHRRPRRTRLPCVVVRPRPARIYVGTSQWRENIASCKWMTKAAWASCTSDQWQTSSDRLKERR